MKAIDWLAQFKIFSREHCAVASRKELQRWFRAGNVRFNAESGTWNEEMDFQLTSVVIFPNGKRITLY